MRSIRSFIFQVSNTGRALLPDTKSQHTDLLMPDLESPSHFWEPGKFCFCSPSAGTAKCHTSEKIMGSHALPIGREPKNHFSLLVGLQPVLYICARLQIHIPTKLLISFQVSCCTCCCSSHVTTASTQRDTASHWYIRLISPVAKGAVYAGVLVGFALISRTRTNDLNFDISEKKLYYFYLS